MVPLESSARVSSVSTTACVSLLRIGFCSLSQKELSSMGANARQKEDGTTCPLFRLGLFLARIDSPKNTPQITAVPARKASDWVLFRRSGIQIQLGSIRRAAGGVMSAAHLPVACTTNTTLNTSSLTDICVAIEADG